MQILFRAPTPADAFAVAADLRPADRAECAALSVDPVDALLDGVQFSALAWTAVIDGAPAAVFGVRPAGTLLDDTGTPWLLGTPAVVRYQRAFMRHSAEYIAEMLSAFPHLLNFVHAENTHAVAWLRRMKFQFQPAAPHGPLGALFHRFEMRADGTDPLLP